jgi:outer membrane protein assembly factor BamB
MRRLLTPASLAATILLMLAAASVANNWPRWRGPEANGVAPPGEYPLQWSATEHVAWKYPLPERSSSTPIAWDQSIFLTTTNEGANVLVCLDLDGKERWKASLGKASEGKNRQYGSGSGPSPVTDGRHVYAYFKSGDLACVDFAGNVVWRKNLQEEYGEDTLWWDLGTSPVLTQNAVVVAVMQTGPSYIVALDKQSGSELWKQDRTFKVPDEADNSYTTPIVHQQGGKEILLVAGADHATAHDAQTGKEIWRVGGLNPRNEGYFRSIASPVLANEVFVVPYSRGDTLTGIKIDGSGDVTKTHTLWRIDNPSGVDVPTPASEDGRVYLVSERGLAFCVDAASGDVIWSKQIPCRPNFRASPVVTADRIYCLHESGTTYVLSKPKESEEPEVLATNELGEFTVASPVFFDGKILIRTYENLYCIQ